jgi:hypothetical protein
MGDFAIAGANPLNQANANRVWRWHMKQLIFDGTAAGVNYKNVHL